jgi:threonylcarbamoyladenosine tRNA methylthiotransferase MtaB
MTYAVLTFGCRANQADSFDIEHEFLREGTSPAPPESADVVIINTCTVTAAADRAARRTIRRISRLNPAARIIATGCYATRQTGSVATLPGVARVVPNDRKLNLGALLGDGWLQARAHPAGSGAPPALRPGARGRTAFPLRVQAGCDERCAYCIVPFTRGPGRSRPLPVVVDQTRRLAAAGYKELWLTGVHLGAWGRDLSPRSGLIDLLRTLDREAGDVTFRLSSLEPMDCTVELVEFVARSGRFLPHLHLPLQHASDRMLAAMRRPYSLAQYRALVDGIRHRMPDAAIGTDLMTGFPGEGDADTELQLAYVEDAPFSYLHVFPYSERPGTEASRLAGKVPDGVARARAARLRGAATTIAARFAATQAGRVRHGLTLEDGSLVLTDNYLKVRIPPGLPRNQRVRVRLLGGTPLRGALVP